MEKLFSTQSTEPALNLYLDALKLDRMSLVNLRNYEAQMCPKREDNLFDYLETVLSVYEITRLKQEYWGKKNRSQDEEIHHILKKLNKRALYDIICQNEDVGLDEILFYLHEMVEKFGFGSGGLASVEEFRLLTRLCLSGDSTASAYAGQIKMLYDHLAKVVRKAEKYFQQKCEETKSN